MSQRDQDSHSSHEHAHNPTTTPTALTSTTQKNNTTTEAVESDAMLEEGETDEQSLKNASFYTQVNPYFYIYFIFNCIFLYIQYYYYNCGIISIIILLFI